MSKMRLDEATPFSDENWMNLLEYLNFKEKPYDFGEFTVYDSNGEPICPYMCHYKMQEEKERIYHFLCGYRKAKELIGGIENERNGLQQ